MTSIAVGKILTSHGIKGHIKIESWMENAGDIFNYELNDKNHKKYRISFVGNLNNDIFIAKIDGITNPEEAKDLRNTELYADLNDDKEIYLEELIGIEVRAENCNGKIISVNNYGAGNIIEIQWENEKQTESLPLIDEYFKKITKDYVVVERPKYV